MKLKDDLWAKDRPEPVVVVDVVVVEIGTGVVAGYPRVIVVVLLREPLPVLLFSIFSPNIESRQAAYNILAGYPPTTLNFFYTKCNSFLKLFV